MALALDELGVAHGERVAIVSPNSARFLTSFFGVSGYGRVLVPINFRLNAEEIAYIVEHSGASVLLYDPELAGEVDDHQGGATASRSTESTTPRSSRRPPTGAAAPDVGGRRGRHLLGQLHLGHDGPAQGRAADPPQLLAQRRRPSAGTPA